MRAILQAELADLLRNPMAWIATCAVAIVSYYFGKHSPYQANGYVIYVAALRAGAVTAAFFVLAAASVAVANERTRGTVRWILPRPVSRVAFVAGKGTAVALFGIWLLAICVLVSYGISSGAGFGDATVESTASESEFEFEGTAELDPEFQAATMRSRTIAATLLLAPALLTIAGLGLLVSCLMRNAAGAVIASVALLLPLQFLPEVLGLGPEKARILPFRVADEALEQLSLFGRAISDATWPPYSVAIALGAIAGAIGLPLLGALLFSRLNITD